MEDADKNSKSLVRITRVGSTPTTGIKNSFKLRLGAVFFILPGCGAEQSSRVVFVIFLKNLKRPIFPETTVPVIHTSSTNAFI